MSRLALTLVFCSLFTLSTARAQISGGLEGKWHHFVVRADGAGSAPLFELWARGDLVAWRTVAGLSADALRGALIWQWQGVDRLPAGDARLSTSVESTVSWPSLSAPSHLVSAGGVVEAIVELRLAPGCSKGCDLAGLDVIELVDGGFSPSRWGDAPVELPAGGPFPLEVGDLRHRWR